MQESLFAKKNRDKISRTISLKSKGSPVMMPNRRLVFSSQAKLLKNEPCLQCVLPSGLDKQSNKATVWCNEGQSFDDGIMCKEKKVPDAEDKAEAIKNICAEAADIGEKCPSSSVGTKNKWAEFTNNSYNKIVLRSINPFQVPIYAGYKKEYAIRMFYHFGPYHMGYVVNVQLFHKENEEFKVTDVGKMVDAGNGNQQSSNDKSTPNTDGVKVEESANVKTKYYSSIHMHTGDTTLIDIADNSESYFDAYTKLAGEGARFSAVANIIAHLRDTTRFFVRDGKYNETIKCIAFRDLWLKWGDPFGKKYKITDDDIVS